jgi:lysophospholipase L1-like esterase
MGKWKGFRINRTESLNEAIDEIHARVVEIINILKQSNKKIILQTHFRVNPAYVDAHTKALNEGLDALNIRLLNTYGKEDNNISLAYLTPDFPASLFLDLVHLNPFGYQLHSYFLSRELQRRCWW